MTLRGPRGAALVLVAAGATFAAVLLLFPPGAYPYLFCPLRTWTGFACPLCGMTRAVAALLRGDLAGALHKNAFILLASAWFLVPAVRWVYAALRWNRAARALIPARAAAPLLAIGLAFGIARNILPGLLGP